MGLNLHALYPGGCLTSEDAQAKGILCLFTIVTGYDLSLGLVTATPHNARWSSNAC